MRIRGSAMRGAAAVACLSVGIAGAGCSRPAAGTAGTAGAASSAAAEAGADAAAGAGARAATATDAGPALPAGATPCPAHANGPTCVRFASNEDAFRWVLAHDPAILAIGEAHAQKGTEAIASATKRFTETMVSILENRASDLLVEAWAGDPKCQREVKQVASAQAPVKQAQAQTNPNEYVALGTRARAIGVTPHLLRPSCDDYAGLADAGADVIPASLSLIKRLTQSDAMRLFERNQSAKNGRMVVTYGGAMHNDLAPSESLRQYSFGPELAAATSGRYVELDMIVPEYVKKTDVWEKLAWYAPFQADTAPRDKPVVYRLGDRSFVLVFASSSPPSPQSSPPAPSR